MEDDATAKGIREMLTTIMLTKEQRLPKPYYQDESVTLYHARAEDILPLLEPVDCCITDPPYGDTALAWDVRVEGWLPILNSNQLWCCGSLKFFLAERFAGWRHVQEIIWEKHNGSNFQADRFRRVHEHVVHFVRDGVAWGECYHAPVYTFNGVGTARARYRGNTPLSSRRNGSREKRITPRTRTTEICVLITSTPTTRGGPTSLPIGRSDEHPEIPRSDCLRGARRDSTRF